MSYFGREPDLFVGRVEAMAAATKALAADDNFSGILLYGPEATGKTACAVELAYLYKDQFDGLVRHQVPVYGESIKGSLVGLAGTLETQLQDFGPEMKDAVHRQAKLEGFLPRLTNLMEQHAIFLLIDGIDALFTPEGSWQDDMWGAVVNALLDHHGGSRLVLTSRRPLVPRPDRLCVVPVPVLSPSEALLLARQLPHLGAVLRGRTKWPMDQAVPLIADLLAAAGGMPGLIRAADKELTSPAMLGALAARGAERGFAAGTAGKSEEYLRLVRKWTRGIRRSAYGAEPPPSGPTSTTGDLDGLAEQHIRLLGTTATAVEDLLDKLAELGRTPLLWSRFAEVDNAARRSLPRAKEHLVALEQQITIMTWPHADFAARLSRLRADVQRDITAFQFERATRSGRAAAAARLGISLQKLQDLVKRRYPSVFSDGHAFAPSSAAIRGAFGKPPEANMAEPQPREQVPDADESHVGAGTERTPTRQATAVPAFSGEVKVEFCRRTGKSWKELADLFSVPLHEKERFDPGDEPRELWEWLEIRSRLPELPDKLAQIGRTELAEIMRRSSS